MLSGRRLFEGETVSDTLAAVLRQEIDWSALPARTPPALRSLLRRCLERDTRKRLRDVSEARIALAAPYAPELAPEAGVEAGVRGARSLLPAVAVAAGLACAAGYLLR